MFTQLKRYLIQFRREIVFGGGLDERGHLNRKLRF